MCVRVRSLTQMSLLPAKCIQEFEAKSRVVIMHAHTLAYLDACVDMPVDNSPLAGLPGK